MRVTIVEDEARLADVLAEFVRDLGHEPEVALSAESAVQLLQRRSPDVIFLDISLPGMNGLEFLQLPLIQAAGIPVVVMSGVATEQQAREALQLGALDFLAKPVALERLATVLDFVAPSASVPVRSRAGKPERRPAPRMRIALDLRITYKHKTWAGACQELSASGMKASSVEPLRRGMTVRLTFSPPDRGQPIDVLALIVRIDRDGAAFWFLDLTPYDAERISRLVASSRS